MERHRSIELTDWLDWGLSPWEYHFQADGIWNREDAGRSALHSALVGNRHELPESTWNLLQDHLSRQEEAVSTRTVALKTALMHGLKFVEWSLFAPHLHERGLRSMLQTYRAARDRLGRDYSDLSPTAQTFLRSSVSLWFSLAQRAERLNEWLHWIRAGGT